MCEKNLIEERKPEVLLYKPPFYGSRRQIKDRPMVRKEDKVGRNDPCPCGSGKKAKKCCWDDINRTVLIYKKKIREMPPEAIDKLIDDLETDKYGEEYISSRTTIKEA